MSSTTSTLTPELTPSPTTLTPTTPSTTTTTPTTLTSTTTTNPSTSPTTSSASSSTTTTTPSSSPATSLITTPTTPTSSSPSPNSIPSSTPIIITSDGHPVTITTIVNETPTAPSSPTPSATNNSSTSFFHNTGAVAGVFTVIGLLALVIIIWVITTAIRRRRAQKFDADVAAAAAEAAASSRSPDFDDYDYTSAHGAAGMYGYSDNSHGTFTQPPMSPETYGMSELGGTAYQSIGRPAPGSDYEKYPPAPGAAGIGAGGVYRTKSTGPGPDPFGAYVAPQDLAQQSLRYKSPPPHDQFDWVDTTLTTGAVGGGYALARGLSQSQQQQPPIPTSLTRNRSQGANTILTQSSQSQYTHSDTHPPLPESYAAHYKQDFNSATNQPPARPISVPSAEDAYGGVAKIPSLSVEDEFPNPFRGGDRPISGITDDSFEQDQSPGFAREDPRTSLRDDEDYGIGKRVLKVANE